jgi:hypothetical protein
MAKIYNIVSKTSIFVSVDANLLHFQVLYNSDFIISQGMHISV